MGYVNELRASIKDRIEAYERQKELIDMDIALLEKCLREIPSEATRVFGGTKLSGVKS